MSLQYAVAANVDELDHILVSNPMTTLVTRLALYYSQVLQAAKWGGPTPSDLHLRHPRITLSNDFPIFDFYE
jgi:hypothetical protein